ncbi:hypothetical protein AGOR_G00179490 [Albula goreensis]|uniref:Immunoglobulin V-set domain-containing protein n=1 Tax=Albula goreensis TaxID=1534307 RepID=A0A8T3D0B7_9TELE|nr:hypothetical protein AGOR_G00179490 [Albula goreensis]
MRNLLIFTFCLAGACVNCITVIGYEGGGAFIRCNYPQGYETNKKYFCKGSHYSCNDLIKTEEKNTCFEKDDKFSLYDNTAERYFTVWINNLQQEDSGVYQCGIDINYIRDFYTEVQLEVKKGQTCRDVSTVTRKVGETFRREANRFWNLLVRNGPRTEP